MTSAEQSSGRVVVGVDGSAGSARALRWAFDEARARGMGVHAVFAWQYFAPWVDPGLGSMFPLGYRPEGDAPTGGYEQTADAVRRILDTAISDVGGSDNDGAGGTIPVTRVTVEGHAAHVLLQTATDRDILVVGSHGHGGFVGTILGSVSQHVVSHAHCPVVVVPAAQRTQAGSALSGTDATRAMLGA